MGFFCFTGEFIYVVYGEYSIFGNNTYFVDYFLVVIYYICILLFDFADFPGVYLILYCYFFNYGLLLTF
jgi:hypothetical protein